MEISFHSRPFRSVILPWVILSFLGFMLFFLAHVGFYFLIASAKKTLTEYLSTSWFTIAFYSIIFPGSIALQYRYKLMKMSHNGEIDPLRIKEYFLERNWRLVSEEAGIVKLIAQKKFESLVTQKKQLIIRYSENDITIELPERYVYDLHHGFKFGKTFLKE